MDLDDFDEPIKPPTRTSRFLPKSSKSNPNPNPNPKPKPEPVPKSETLVPKPKPEESSISAASTTTVIAETPSSSAGNGGAAAMDVDFPPEPLVGESNDEPMNDDGSEDEVIREIDLFFHAHPNDSKTNLYVFQYPLRPCWRPYELDERCEKVRFKQDGRQVQIDLAVEGDSKNYDNHFANNLHYEKQTLSSSWNAPCTTNHAIGVLIGNKLHLSPVHAVLQLRPSMEHLNLSSSKKKTDVTESVQATTKAGVTIKAEASNEGGPVGSSKMQSWITLKHQGSRSEFSARYRQEMVTEISSPMDFSTNTDDYISSLCPRVVSNETRPGFPSRRSLLKLPLEERLKKWLCEGPPMHRFSALKLLAPDNSEEEVLGILLKHACLVQGLWLARSGLLYLGASGPILLARDYILLLFSQNPIINNSQLHLRGALEKPVKEILHVLGSFRISFKDWKLKEPTDMSFIKLHPDIVREQGQSWQKQEEKILNAVRGASGKGGPSMKNSIRPSNIITNKPVTSISPDKGVARASSAASAGRTGMSAERREALLKAVQHLFQKQKVWSLQRICQGVRDWEISVNALPAKGGAKPEEVAYPSMEELQSVLSQVAINVHDAYVLKSPADNPEHNPFRKLVIDLFCGKERNAHLKKADIVEASKIALKREPTSNEYNKVLPELCVSRGGKWFLKSGDENPR